MRSPKDMTIIEIDITNACNKRCSNCTRLCGHHRKPFFMDFDTFKRAVDSLDGYEGVHSLMGGEPTMHSEFERFLRYLGSKFPRVDNPLIYPQKGFIKAIHRRELCNYRIIQNGARISVNGPGIFSNTGPTYRKHYEIISDILPYQGLNDHINPIYHQFALITRKELEIPDDEWVKLRDACWVQNEWSAGITPKGAFFCEVAGVLDMLFEGPGGWPIEPGWWKREPGDFGEQLHWCELCGYALDTFTRDSKEEVDDVSPDMYEKLKEIDSPKLKSGLVNIVLIENGKIAEESKRENIRFNAVMPYAEHVEDRFNAFHSALFVRDYKFAVIPDGAGFGVELNRLLKENGEWFVLHSANVKIADDFEKRLEEYVLNPGTLHYLNLTDSDDTTFVSNADTESTGYAALFSKNAISLREIGFDRIANTGSFEEILALWSRRKVVELSSKIEQPFGGFSLKKDANYAVWGTGFAGGLAADALECAGARLFCAVDANRSCHGSDFFGAAVHPPEYLAKHAGDFDYLIVANNTRFNEIKQEAMKMGIAEERILFMSDLKPRCIL